MNHTWLMSMRLFHSAGRWRCFSGRLANCFLGAFPLGISLGDDVSDTRTASSGKPEILTCGLLGSLIRKAFNGREFEHSPHGLIILLKDLCWKAAPGNFFSF